jgi:hypothetical protein
METQVIVLNGGSSSGKSGIARCLQAVLPDPWLVFGVDTLIEAMPGPSGTDAGLEYGAGGEVVVGPEFRALEAAWITGIAAMARAGARIIVDEGGTGSPAWRRPAASPRRRVCRARHPHADCRQNSGRLHGPARQRPRRLALPP